MPILTIPTAWSHEVGGQNRFQLPEGNLETVLLSFAEEVPELRRRLLDDNGKLHLFYAFFVDDEKVQRGLLTNTFVSSESRIDILPPLAGG